MCLLVRSKMVPTIDFSLLETEGRIGTWSLLQQSILWVLEDNHHRGDHGTPLGEGSGKKITTFRVSPGNWRCRVTCFHALRFENVGFCDCYSVISLMITLEIRLTKKWKNNQYTVECLFSLLWRQQVAITWVCAQLAVPLVKCDCQSRALKQISEGIVNCFNRISQRSGVVVVRGDNVVVHQFDDKKECKNPTRAHKINVLVVFFIGILFLLVGWLDV